MQEGGRQREGISEDKWALTGEEIPVETLKG